MGILKNQSDGLDKSFENHNYLPQKILLEDIDIGMVNYIKDQGISMVNEKNENRRVPVVWATQELWAERKQNFKIPPTKNLIQIAVVVMFFAFINSSQKECLPSTKEIIDAILEPK